MDTDIKTKQNIETEQWFESIETIDHEMTDEEVFDTVLEAMIDKEYPYLDQMMDSLIYSEARKATNWQYREDLALWEYKKHRKELNGLYKKMRVFRKQRFDNGWSDGSEDNSALALNLQMKETRNRIGELQPIAAMWWDRFIYSSKKCFEISIFTTSESKLMAEESRRNRLAKKKSPEQMVRYWKRLFDRAHRDLERAEGRMEKAESRIQSVSNRGREVSNHFPLGRVGGSGKHIQSLNRQRERDIDAGVKAYNELEDARRRVKTLEVRTSRFEDHLTRWESIVTKNNKS